VGSLLEKDGFTSLRKLVLNRGQGTLRMEIVSYHLDRNGLPKRLCPFIDPGVHCLVHRCIFTISSDKASHERPTNSLQ
jgi:hypothetical protein